MKKIFISAALASMMMASCQNDVLVENISNEGDMFTLEVNQGGSRTALGEGFQTVWSSDDKIYVTSEDGKVSGVLSYKGDNKFTGYIFGGKSTRLSHVIFPVPVDGKVELKQPKGDRLDLPMIGELGSDKASVEMANVCALVNLPVEGKPSIGLSSVGENTLTGHYEYKDGKFVFVPGEGSITVNVTDGKAFFATAVPTDNQGVEEDQVELKINGTDETITVPVEQGLISENNVPEIEFNEDGTMEEPVMNVTTAEILEKALNQYDEVKLAGNIEITEAITIAAEKKVTLDLNGFALHGQLKGNGSTKLTIIDSNEIYYQREPSNITFSDVDLSIQGGTFAYDVADLLNDKPYSSVQDGTAWVVFPTANVLTAGVDTEENGNALENAVANAEEGDVIYLTAGQYDIFVPGIGPLELRKSVSIIGVEGTIIKGLYKGGNTNRPLSLFCENAKEFVLQNLIIIGNGYDSYLWIRQTPKSTGPEKYTQVKMINVHGDLAIIDNRYNDGHTIDVDLLGCSFDQFTVDAWNPDPIYGNVSFSNLTYDEASEVTVNIQTGVAFDNITINGKNPTNVGIQ